VDYATLAQHCERLEATTKRLEMTGILVELLGHVRPEEMLAVARLLQGQVAPDWEGLEFGLAEKMILQALARASGLGAAKLDVVTSVYHDVGDLGGAAQQLLANSQSKQVGLMAFGGDDDASPPVNEVFASLVQIAQMAGADSQNRKQKLLESLLAKIGPLEARFLIRTIAGRLRLGVADLTFLEALTAWHVGRGVRSVTEMDDEERAEHVRVRGIIERAYDLQSDLGVVAALLASEGLDALQKVRVEHGIPLRPMAAERLKNLPDILEKHEGRSAMEYKYDGLRLQCHVTPDSVRLFSRRMEDLTAQFPDVQEILRKAFKGKSAIVEGEGVAWDADAGRMRPFQDISRRRGRKTGLGEDTRQESALSGGAAVQSTMMDDVPVKVFLFDVMASDGAAHMHEPYASRRARLPDLFDMGDRIAISTMEIVDTVDGMDAFFLQAVDDGAEGVMCKSLEGVYKAGNRGFDWIKYKTDYTEDLVDSMDLVVIGAFRGRGRRAGWHGALLMAARDEETGRFASVCKLGTGFDDETLKGLKEKFAAHETPGKPDDVDSAMVPDVWFEPAIVMEVQAAELSLSPTHRAGWGRLKEGAGLAARFPRFMGRWRDDKGPDQTTTVSEIVTMYEQQSVERRAN
jgi:DNA ligase-1